MRVDLIDFNGKGTTDERWYAADILIFTKNTRLQMKPELLQEIRGWSEERKLEELRYMANTIPSSWEFVSYTFLITDVSRAFTHQAVRTRAASYAQQTMRVLDMGDYDYVLTEANRRDSEALRLIDEHNARTRQTYRALRALGQPPEDARGILPTNISTNIAARYTLRTLSELARSRTGGRTQGEYVAVANAMIDRVLEVHPWAADFLLLRSRDLFAEIEAFAAEEFGGDLLRKGRLLKIVDHLRKEMKP